MCCVCGRGSLSSLQRTKLSCLQKTKPVCLQKRNLWPAKKSRRHGRNSRCAAVRSMELGSLGRPQVSLLQTHQLCLLHTRQLCPLQTRQLLSLLQASHGRRLPSHCPLSRFSPTLDLGLVNQKKCFGARNGPPGTSTGDLRFCDTNSARRRPSEGPPGPGGPLYVENPSDEGSPRPPPGPKF